MSSSSSLSSSPFSPSLLSSYQCAFSLFDDSGSGWISTSEVTTLIRALGFNLTEERFQCLINQLDKTGDGRMDFPTVHEILVRIKSENNENEQNDKQITREQLTSAFHWFDLSRSGKMPVEQFVELLRNYGEPFSLDDVTNLLREVEIDGDGRIDIQLFLDSVLSSSQPPDLELFRQFTEQHNQMQSN
jgi:calmodulin